MNQRGYFTLYHANSSCFIASLSSSESTQSAGANIEEKNGENGCVSDSHSPHFRPPRLDSSIYLRKVAFYLRIFDFIYENE